MQTSSNTPMRSSLPLKPPPVEMGMLASSGTALTSPPLRKSGRKAPPPSLVLHPIAPPPIAVTVDDPLSSPAPIASTSFLPPPSLSGLAARRQKGNKQLHLVLPNTAFPASLSTPLTATHPNSIYIDGESRSLPSSPISLAHLIGVEGTEPEDRTIGRLMMKQQADEMREQMRGGRGMKRRTSIPRLNTTGTNRGANLGTTNGGSAVQLIRRDAVERNGFDEGKMEVDEMEDTFPYEMGPREILPGIWLGSEQNARDPKVLKSWKITHVLNVAKEVLNPWEGEVIPDSIEEVDEQEVDAPIPSPIRPLPPRSISAINRHRRTKTAAVINITQPLTDAPINTTGRPQFVRPTTSTPNMQSAFHSSLLTPAVEVKASFPLPTISGSPANADNPFPIPSPSVPPRPSSLRLPSNRISGRPAIEWLWLRWSHDEANLVEALKFQTAFDFIDRARAQKGRVLIHCQCGVSRSATVVIAYCMREAARALEQGSETEELKGVKGMHDAYSFVKEKSQWVGPNLSLVFQLVAYERTLRGAPIANDDDEEPPYLDGSEMEGIEVTSSSPAISSGAPLSSSSSDSSTDSRLSTPDKAPSRLTNLLSISSDSSLPSESGVEGAAERKRKIESIGNTVDEVLAPTPQVSHVGSVSSTIPESRTSPTFEFASPPQLYADLSPLPLYVTASPPTSFIEIESPPSPQVSTSRSSHQSQLPHRSSPKPRNRFAFPGNPKATLLTSKPTAAAYSAREKVVGSQPPSVRGLSINTTGLQPTRNDDGRSTIDSAGHYRRGSGGSGNGEAAGTPSTLMRFFGGASQSERRASHRRVFSEDVAGLFRASSSSPHPT